MYAPLDGELAGAWLHPEEVQSNGLCRAPFQAVKPEGVVAGERELLRRRRHIGTAGGNSFLRGGLLRLPECDLVTIAAMKTMTISNASGQRTFSRIPSRFCADGFDFIVHQQTTFVPGKPARCHAGEFSASVCKQFFQFGQAGRRADFVKALAHFVSRRVVFRGRAGP